MRKTIHYLKGDATQPIGDGNKIIVHICNDIGKWGAGFVLAVSKRWTEPEAEYRKINDYELGNVQYVSVEDDIIIANMIAQHGVGYDENNNPPIQYGALRICLADVNDRAYKSNATLHMPRIGTGLAGGDWQVIENIIKNVMSVDVYVYDLN